LASAQDRSIQVQILIGHAVYREASGHRCTASGAIDFADATYGSHRRIKAIDQKSGHTIIYQLAHRSPVAGNDRRSAGERFHYREAKRLIEIYEME
jgi:hypothetical protein